MATNRLEASNAEAGGETAAAANTGRNEAGAGGLKSWLPLIVNLVLMPVLAYGMTIFVLSPKLRQTSGQAGVTGSEKSGNSSEQGTTDAAGRSKFLVPLPGKILVNVAGTGGTRYLLVTLTLVSPN